MYTISPVKGEHYKGGFRNTTEPGSQLRNPISSISNAVPGEESWKGEGLDTEEASDDERGEGDDTSGWESEDERLKNPRPPRIYTEMDTMEGFWKLVLLACDELGITMTDEIHEKISDDEAVAFHRRIPKAEVYQAERARNIALRKKDNEENPYRPWGNRNVTKKLMNY
ncbi:hypothetical protein BJ508DRAFT_336562 [Ascobolus immersus RN42]|uniref:Uncharacterized protein n=1 Tax=Ascobolus immersus RN42 TaxID=1160509 RepID=A0A3N4H849_ASCIM|nr:hypothetical protein BJ508DRAFT_336562 [Ascobolus immersus RN42]